MAGSLSDELLQLSHATQFQASTGVATAVQKLQGDMSRCDQSTNESKQVHITDR